MQKREMLRKVPAFAQTSDDVIEEIANALQEIQSDAGNVIFHKGDIGDSMYLIYSGEVRIHEGDYTFAIFKDGDIFGELSLYDPAPRSATATIVNNAILLKITQKAFYHIMSDRIEVVQGILKILCQRLRQQNKHLTNLKGQISWLFSKFHEIY